MPHLLPFHKMTGAGNDFVVLDFRSTPFSLSPELVALLCNRPNGIGADGLLAVLPSNSPSAHFKMRYFNRDGSEAEMCGNGARCFAKFAASLLSPPPPTLSFQTPAGTLHANLLPNGDVELAMSTPHSLQGPFPLQLPDTTLQTYSLNTGVPHAVTFVQNLQDIPVENWGRSIRFHPHFAPAGTNANFVQILSPSQIAIRTYERGVEAETLACGTGATAAALIYSLVHNAPPPISVHVKSGDTLTIRFSKSENPQSPFSNVHLAGPAITTFTGNFPIPDKFVQN